MELAKDCLDKLLPKQNMDQLVSFTDILSTDSEGCKVDFPNFFTSLSAIDNKTINFNKEEKLSYMSIDQ